MAALNSGQIKIPDQIFDGWYGSIGKGSAVATLSQSIPMTFGQGESMTFDIGEAEYVGEGQNKGPSTVTPTVKTVTPVKFHKTVRVSEEVQWADQDHQLNVLKNILALIQPALARALDIGVFHAINPTGGAAITPLTESLSATPNVVTTADGDKAYANMDAADSLVLADSFLPRDIALDPTFASSFATARSTSTEQRLYPDFKVDTTLSQLDGHNASVSKTVGAVSTGATTHVLGFVGDFSAIQWGIQRDIGLELITYGDPDGNGDLKRNNQIAFRAEVIYGWAIANLNAFAVIKSPTV